MNVTKSVGLGVALALGLCGAASANIVNNGDFAAGFADWTITNAASGSIISTFAGPPTDAGFGANQGLDDTISQNLSTAIGQLYTVSFQLKVDTFVIADHPNGNDFSASIGGDTLFSQTNIPQQGWTTYTYSYTATSALTDLSFSGRNGPNWDYLTAIDVESVTTSVPEPSTIGLMIAGALGMFGFGIRRRTNKPAAISSI